MKSLPRLLTLLLALAAQSYADNHTLFHFEVCCDTNSQDIDIYYVAQASPKNDSLYSKIIAEEYHNIYTHHELKIFGEQFKTQRDMHKWLNKLWENERSWAKKHPNVHLLEARHQGKLCCLLSIDIDPKSINKNQLKPCHKKIIHIRLNSYGENDKAIKAFIVAAQKYYMPDCDAIIVDLRKVNGKEIDFFTRQMDFTLYDTPFANDLSPVSGYVGLMKELK